MTGRSTVVENIGWLITNDAVRMVPPANFATPAVHIDELIESVGTAPAERRSRINVGAVASYPVSSTATATWSGGDR